MSFGGGDRGFTNPVVGNQGALTRPAIKSPNFLAGVSGWSINRDGSVEFNNGTFRGTLTANELNAGSIGSSTIVNSDFQGGTMEETLITFDTVGGRILLYATTVVTTSVTVSGSFTPPAGITSLLVQGWGNGGRAGNAPSGFAQPMAGGGSGGEYAADTLDVTPLVAYPYTMGVGVDTVMAGNTKTLRAHHGKNGIDNSSQGGASAFGSTNAVHFSSGPGGNGGNAGGGGGGSSAGTSSGGNGGHNGTSGGPGAGGAAPAGGGKGGDGKATVNGQNGSNPGGGGGGTDKADNPGNGGTPQLIISYVSAQSLIGSVAAVAGSDALGNNYPALFMGQMVAVDPVALNTPETWHTLGTLSNFTVTRGRFRIDDQGKLEVDVGVNGNGANVLTTTFSVTIPLQYRPAVVRRATLSESGRAITAGDQWPTLVVNTNGTVQVLAQAGITSALHSNVSFPLD